MKNSKQKTKILATPSELITFLDSPYAAWYDRACKIDKEKFLPFKDPKDSLSALLQNKGHEFEAKILEDFQMLSKNITRDRSFEEVKLDIQNGVEVIYQGKLETEHFYGTADFIVRIEDGSYEIYDSKLSKTVKPYMILQLCIYSEAIQSIQGKMPERLHLITGTGVVENFRLEEYYGYFKTIEKDFVRFLNNFDINSPPRACDYQNYGNWSEKAQSELLLEDNLKLIATLTVNQRKKLNSAGILTTKDFREKSIDPKNVKLSEAVYERLKIQAQLQFESQNLSKPKFLISKNIELPPPTLEDLFFDMEGYPLYGKNGLEYLFGVTDTKGIFYDFWAHNEEEEKKAFENFIDFAFKKYKRNPKMHIYHYASYEVTAMRKLSTMYATKEYEVDTLLKFQVFVDLYKVVKKSLIVGGENYSIKTIEKCYRPKRQTEVATAGDSVIAYAEWLASGESKNPHESPKLQAIYLYNKDDCASTKELFDWLIEIGSKENKITTPNLEVQIEFNTEEHSRAQELRKKYLMPNETDEVYINLAYLLDFNRRKDKPLWWRFFDRYDLELDEMQDDTSFISEAHFKNKADDLYLYHFDPREETKIKPGDEVIDLNDHKYKVMEIDTVKGLLALKHTSAKKDPAFSPSQTLTLMAHSYFNTKTIDERIEKFFLDYKAAPLKHMALRDFFKRNTPRLKIKKDPLINPKNPDRLEEALIVVKNMDSTTLCIQGPPGTGKTYTAKNLIAMLVRSGKKVALMSNSHKAIDHLLIESMSELSIGNDQNIRALRINRDKVEYADDRILLTGTLPAPKKLEQYSIIAGTVFALSKFDEEYFDYLFIDEAGQVALANLISAGIAAKNIVLMGDQQQLSQPIEGSHPYRTGESILDYYLDGAKTIDDKLGLFLNRTYRMHDKITKPISECVYESKLVNDPDCNNRILINTDKAGIKFIEVNHTGNSQGSFEEVEVIKTLISDLLNSKFTDKKGQNQGNLTTKDILIVAPYNLQVNNLKSALHPLFGEELQIGTVDKFQGQEAMVVILSMTASSEEDISARGIDFLFSLNRLNVAITRAKAMAYIVGSSELKEVRGRDLSKMRMLNFWFKLIQQRSI